MASINHCVTKSYTFNMGTALLFLLFLAALMQSSEVSTTRGTLIAPAAARIPCRWSNGVKTNLQMEVD